MQELIFQMLGAFAQFERSLIKEKQREGIAKAKQEGRITGPHAKFQIKTEKKSSKNVIKG